MLTICRKSEHEYKDITEILLTVALNTIPPSTEYKECFDCPSLWKFKLSQNNTNDKLQQLYIGGLKSPVSANGDFYFSVLKSTCLNINAITDINWLWVIPLLYGLEMYILQKLPFPKVAVSSVIDGCRKLVEVEGDRSDKEKIMYMVQLHVLSMKKKYIFWKLIIFHS